MTCSCGRSPTGLCVGWHGLTEEKYFQGKLDDMSEITQLLSEFNSKVWNEKKQKELSLKDSIKIDVPETLNQFKKDLIAMHNLESN